MARNRSTWVGVAGALATLLVHMLALLTATWNDGALHRRLPPDATGAGANSGSPGGSSHARTITIRLDSDSVQAESTHPLHAALLEALRTPPLLEITGPDSLPLPPSEPDPYGQDERDSNTDLIAQVKMAGLYEGQIRARIERAWVKPSDPVANGKFICRVLVKQERRGKIREVELQDCPGLGKWERSLVDAIFSASPLPAPPDQRVFVDEFSMVFEALQYSEAPDLDLDE